MCVIFNKEKESLSRQTVYVVEEHFISQNAIASWVSSCLSIFLWVCPTHVSICHLTLFEHFHGHFYNICDTNPIIYF